MQGIGGTIRKRAIDRYDRRIGSDSKDMDRCGMLGLLVGRMVVHELTRASAM